MKGNQEVLIESEEDLFRMLQILENERQSNSTKMNDRSSRSHCVMDLKMYTKLDSEKVHVNFIRFLDMAGSERPKKSGAEGMAYWQAVGANWSLTIFARACYKCGALKKPLTGGEKLPLQIGIDWKETSIAKYLKESMNGLAFSTFIFCLSTHDCNSGESFATMAFAE